MDALATFKTAGELLSRLIKWGKHRADPLRLQAERMLEAFSAHDVKAHQVCALLPADIQVKATAWSSADTLLQDVSPLLLRWTAETLALNPAWLDGEPVCRQAKFAAHCKSPAQLYHWLRERYLRGSKSQWDAGASLCVLCACESPMTSAADGPLVLMLRETFAEVHGRERYRYTLLSDGWHLDHSPCTASLAAACAITLHLHLPIHALTVPARRLRALEEGRCFACEVWRGAQGRWHPDDFVKAPPGKDTDWMRTIRTEARRMLSEDKLGHLMPD